MRLATQRGPSIGDLGPGARARRRVISFHRQVKRIARLHGPKAAQAWIDAIVGHRNGLSEAALRSAIVSGNVASVDAVLQASSLQQALGKGMEAPLRTSLIAAGESSSAVLRSQGLAATFNAAHPSVIMAARTQAAELVVGITDDARAVVREIITLGAERGLTVAEQARAIKQTVGLPPAWAAAPGNLARELREGRVGAATSRRLNSRTKTRIKRAIANDVVTDALVREITEEYAESLVQARAIRIARTETLRAANAGLQESWQQARAQGVLPARARVYWLVTPDDRLSEAHARIPGMNPNGRVVGESFFTPDGLFRHPPTRPHCRCSVGLAFPPPGEEAILPHADDLAYSQIGAAMTDRTAELRALLVESEARKKAIATEQKARRAVIGAQAGDKTAIADPVLARLRRERRQVQKEIKRLKQEITDAGNGVTVIAPPVEPPPTVPILEGGGRVTLELRDPERKARFKASSQKNLSQEVKNGLEYFNRMVDRTWSDRLPRAVRFQVKPNVRAHMERVTPPIGSTKPPTSVIHVNPRDPPSIVIHELGHHLQENISELRKAAEDFWALRTKESGKGLQSLRKLTGKNTYRASEYADENRFFASYVGKVGSVFRARDGTLGVYATGQEIVSMGLEFMFKDPALFFARDPEHFEFILAIMRGRVPKVRKLGTRYVRPSTRTAAPSPPVKVAAPELPPVVLGEIPKGRFGFGVQVDEEMAVASRKALNEATDARDYVRRVADELGFSGSVEFKTLDPGIGGLYSFRKNIVRVSGEFEQQLNKVLKKLKDGKSLTTGDLRPMHILNHELTHWRSHGIYTNSYDFEWGRRLEEGLVERISAATTNKAFGDLMFKKYAFEVSTYHGEVAFMDELIRLAGNEQVFVDLWAADTVTKKLAIIGRTTRDQIASLIRQSASSVHRDEALAILASAPDADVGVVALETWKLVWGVGGKWDRNATALSDFLVGRGLGQ